MRKLMMIVVAVMMATMSANAQQAGDFSVGANASYSFKTESFAPGIRVQYNILRMLRAEIGGDYWLKKDLWQSYDAFLNLHLLIHASKAFKVYPFAGIGYVNTKVDGQNYTDEVHKVHVVVPEKVRDNVFGNVGVGIQVNFTSHFGAFAEGKYQFKDDDRVCASLGLMYIF
jgi:hypothetical protein